MPIESKNPIKTLAEVDIDKCRAVVNGERSVHAGEETYLPKLNGMTDEQYDSYRLRTLFFNATARTVDGLIGSVFRKDITTDFDSRFEAFSNRVTTDGLSLPEYFKQVFEEVLSVGFCGTFIDYSQVPTGTSMAQAESLGYGANWTLYRAENIRNWKFKTINGKRMLSLVVLDEGYNDEETSDEFEDATEPAIRVLRLDDTGYSSTKYIKSGTNWKVIQYEEPVMAGQRLRFIPFVMHTPDSNIDSICPPLLDLVNVNIKHYQLKADHSHALHFVALPTPYVLGVDSDDESAPSSVGPSKLWLIGNQDAKVGMLEYTGAGIESISNELTRLEQMMAQLGARLLSPSKDFAETATAEQIKSIGEHSMLYSIVGSIQNQLDNVCSITASWIGASSFITKINKDFVSSKLDPTSLLSLVTAWQEGAISKQTMFDNLKQGEIVNNNSDFEEEEALILEGLGVSAIE